MLNFRLRRPKSRKLARPDDGELIAYLDGQLSPERQDEIPRLLEGSWELRGKLAEIEADTKFYVDACAHELPQGFPDKAEIWRRLQAAERATRGSRRGLRTPSVLAETLTSSVRRYERLVLYGLSASCLLLFILSRLPVRTVSAAEVLGQAETAELTAFDAEQAPVVHQTLAARTGNGEAGSASWEIWSSVKTAKFKETVRGSQKAIAEMKSMLKVNHMDERRPLSVASYRGWRQRAQVRQEAVSRARLGDGENAFRIDTAVEGSVPDEGILQTSLFIRERDWHPVAQQFELRLGGELRTDELSEVGYELIPPKQAAAIFGEIVAPAAREPVSKVPALPSLPTPVQLWSIELRVRYALHRLGACIGEPITVTQTSDRVQVRGLVETEERKQQLLQQLATIDGRWLKTDIKTVQEVSESERSRNGPLPETYTVVATPDSSTSSGTLPIESLLANAGVKYDTAEVTRLSNDAVSSARGLLMEAWALKHLAQRYGTAAPEDVDANERPLLDAMFRDHTHALEERSSILLLVLRKFLPAQGAGGEGTELQGGEADWNAICGQTLATATEIEKLALPLFSHADAESDAAGGATGNTVEAKAKELDSKLAELRNYLGQLEAKLGQGLLPIPALAQVKEEPAMK
jgi:anti-sigma factor RsiW